MKIFYSLILFVVILISQISLADDLQSEFMITDKTTIIKEGDIVEATLRVWPIENADLSQFKKLEKTVLFNAFYLAQVTSLEVSPNNADVVEMVGLFIVKSSKVQPSFIFKYNNIDITLNSGVLSIKELGDQNKDFYVLNQSLNSSKMWMFFSLTAVLIALFLVKKRDSIMNLLRQNKKKQMKQRYDQLFKVADKREDFELIYKEKNAWIQLLEESTPAHYDFFKIINQHQFKKHWGNEEYADIRASFDVIRRSFEK